MTRKEHLLVLLGEECAEVSKAVAKALRFGLGPTADGGVEYDNSSALISELTDLLTVIDLLQEAGIVDLRTFEVPYELTRDKRAKVAKYLEVSLLLGRVDD